MTTIKHALRYNGAAYDADAQLRHEDPSITSGSGRALCACGALSEVLPSGSARRAWFKEHRVAPAAPAAPEPDQEDLLGLLDAPETKAAPAPEPAPASDTVEQAVPFAPHAPVSYWRYLGRDGSKVFVNLLYPALTVLPDSDTRSVLLRGPEGEVAAASEDLRQLWQDAVQAAAAWKASDPEYLARPKGGVTGRMAAYHMTGEFFLRYVREQAMDRALANA